MHTSNTIFYVLISFHVRVLPEKKLGGRSFQKFKIIVIGIFLKMIIIGGWF